MSLPKLPLNVSRDFQQKQPKKSRLPKKRQFHYNDVRERKPPIPKFAAKYDVNKDSVEKKDFVLGNALEAVKSVPQMPTTPCIVDTRTGEGQPLTRVGKCPKYISGKNYGQVPSYIKRRVKSLEEARKTYDKYLTSRTQHSQFVNQIPEEEHSQLLTGLRENWQELNSQYLSMSLVVDSYKKKIRKEILEQQMKNLEKDIKTLQSGKVYISG